MTSTKPLPRVVALFALVALLVAACAGAGPSDARPSVTPSAVAPSDAAPSSTPPTDSMAALITAAQAEGSLTTIALSRTWCEYGTAIDVFKAKYGLEVNELSPDSGFADQLEAIRANKDKGSQAPDVIDVGLSFGASAKAGKLLAPYKVSTWDTIPAKAKDPDGYWYGDYYGVLAFETNRNVVTNVPEDWTDLLDPSHLNQVALAGDPRVSSQAIQTVYAAGLANGGSLDNAKPGLEFFKKLKAAGTFLPTVADVDSIDRGATPITIRWSYNALTHRDAAAGDPDIAVTVPRTGRLGGLYVQAISAYAPHPSAARLWMEFLYSDEGQNIWLSGYCNPIRFEDLSNRSVIPAEMLAKLPDSGGVVFPTLAQLNAATTLITSGWDAAVGADVK